MDQVSWTLRVTATHTDTARVVARRHQFSVGRPLHFDADYQHVTALEYALGAVGAEIVNGLRLSARRRRLELDDIEAVVEGDLGNPLAYLEVVGATEPPSLTGVRVKVYVASPHDEQTWNTLWNETRERLPLVRMFGAALALTVDLRIAA